ncbi:hypothetical protein ABW20_dc0105184 [Dactylellina cionopaga]|nr:hypothetical protein ABW20_dc0105184 [Dactylellina cionopaga]
MSCEGPEPHTPISHILVHKWLYKRYDIWIGSSTIRNRDINTYVHPQPGGYNYEITKGAEIDNYLDDPIILPSSLSFGSQNTTVYLGGLLRLKDTMTQQWYPNSPPTVDFLVSEHLGATTLRYFFKELERQASRLFEQYRSHNPDQVDFGRVYEVGGGPTKLRFSPMWVDDTFKLNMEMKIISRTEL